MPWASLGELTPVPVWNQLTCGNDAIPWPEGYPTSSWSFSAEHINEETYVVLRNGSHSSLNVTCLLYDGNGFFMGEGAAAVPTGQIAVIRSTEIVQALYGVRGHGYLVGNKEGLTNGSLTLLDLGSLIYTTSWVHEVTFNAWPVTGACTSPVEWPYWEIRGPITADGSWEYGADCYTDLRLANCGTSAVNPHLTMYNRSGQVVVDRDLSPVAPGQTMFLPLHMYYVGTDVYGRARITWSPPDQPLRVSGRLFCNSGSDCRSLKRYAAAIPGECISTGFVVPYWEGFFVGTSTTRSTRTLLAVSNPHTDCTAYVSLWWTNMLVGTQGTWSVTVPPGGAQVLDITDIAASGTNGYGWARLSACRYPTADSLTVNAWCYLRQEGRQTAYPYHIDRSACWVPLDGPEASPLYFDYWQQKASGSGDFDRFTQYLFTNPGTGETAVSVVFTSTSGQRWTNTVTVPAGGFTYFNSHTVVTNAGTNVVEGYAVVFWTNAPELEVWSVLVQEHGEGGFYRQAAWATIPKSAAVAWIPCSTGDCRGVEAAVEDSGTPPFVSLSWTPSGSGEEPLSFDVQLAWRPDPAQDWGEWADLRRRTRAREMRVMVRDGEYRFRVRGRTALGRTSTWSAPVTTRVEWAGLSVLTAESSPRNLARKVRVSNGKTQQIILYLQPAETSTWYDLGFDTGYLIADDISNYVDNCIFPIYAGLGWTGTVYEDRSRVFTNLIRLPARHEEELHGLYDGMTNRFGGAPMSAAMGRPMDYRDFVMANLWADAFGAGCRSFVDWNQSGDITGRMALVGFIDFHAYLISNSWLAVYDFPDAWTDRIDSVFPVNPGLVTMIYFGMNSSGVWESLVSAWPRRGYDWGTRTNRMFWADGSLYRRVLEEETSITGAYYHILDEATGGVMFCSDSLHLAQPGNDGQVDSAIHERLYSLFPGQSVPAGQPTNRTCLRYAGWNGHLLSNRLDWSTHYLHELMQVPMAPYGAGFAERVRGYVSAPDYDGVRRSTVAELYEISRSIASRSLDCDIPVNWGPNGATYQWSLWLPPESGATNDTIAFIGLPTDPRDPFHDDGTRPEEIMAYRWSDFFSLGADSDADGLVDDWERQWFGTLYWDADDDPDGDGCDNAAEQRDGGDPTSHPTDDDLDDDSVPNYAEAVAGTDMNDPGSVLRTCIRFVGGAVSVSWTGKSSRLYTVLSATNLAAPYWCADGASTSGVEGVMEHLVEQSNSPAFFRVRVRME